MLVLTRKLGEKIIIGDSITVTIVSIDEHRIQLGVDAPKQVPVYRLEVIEKIKNQNKQAVSPNVVVAKSIARKLKKLSKNFKVS